MSWKPIYMSARSTTFTTERPESVGSFSIATNGRLLTLKIILGFRVNDDHQGRAARLFFCEFNQACHATKKTISCMSNVIYRDNNKQWCGTVDWWRGSCWRWWWWWCWSGRDVHNVNYEDSIHKMRESNLGWEHRISRAKYVELTMRRAFAEPKGNEVQQT